MAYLTMDMCQQMIKSIVSTVQEDGGKPVAIAICDDSSSLVALLKMDNVAARVVHLAQHKAYTAVRMQVATASFMARIDSEKLDIAYFCDPKLTPFPGGAPIIDSEGRIIGGVGISGRSSEEDQYLASAIASINCS